MAEEIIQTEKKKKTPLDIALLIISIISGIMALVLFGKGEYHRGLFIFIGTMIMCYCFFKPIFDFVAEAFLGDKPNMLLKGIRLALNETYVIALVITGYKFVYTYPIIKDEIYWFYKIVAYATIIFIINIIIFKIKNKVRELRDNSASLKRYIISITIIIFSFAYSIVLPLSKLYSPYKAIDLSNLKTPYKLVINEGDKSGLSSGLTYEIKDKAFIEKFVLELSKVKTANMRNLDLLNFEAHYVPKDEDYTISLYYKTSNGYDRIIHNTDEGYITRLEVFNNEIIYKDIDPTPGKSVIYKYRIELSPEYMEELLKKLSRK